MTVYWRAKFERGNWLPGPFSTYDRVVNSSEPLAETGSRTIPVLVWKSAEREDFASAEGTAPERRRSGGPR